MTNDGKFNSDICRVLNFQNRMTHSKDISEKNKFLNRHLIKCPRLETFFKTQNMSMNKYLLNPLIDYAKIDLID